jgi:hypothetical protein
MSRRKTRKRKKRPPPPQRRQEPPRRRTAPPPSRDERVLRERILRFTYQDRFKADFESAIHCYFGEEAWQDNTLAVDEDEIPGFQEWYINDYVTSGGERIIDLFTKEKGSRLPAAQREMLDDWRRINRYRLFEVQAVEPGVGVTAQDLLSGEVLEVNDVSSSYSLVKWQVALLRPLLTNGRLHFAGSGMSLPPSAKSDLLEPAQELWEEYQTQHPQASLDEFYRDHSLDLHHRMVEIATAPPPPVYTPEGHLLEACTARYAVTNPRAVEERLDQTEELICVGPADEDEAALAYVWLLTDRSRVPEIPIEGKGMILQTNFVIEPEQTTHRSLGDIRVWRDRLELSCLSRERLKAGKALLKESLGRLIRHLGDEHQDIESMLALADAAPSARPREPISETQKAVTRQMMMDEYRKWLDEPIPALDGKSPRQAARDPAMRGRLEELLKAVEYMEEQRRRDGEPYNDVADIRRDLGLPPR